MAIARQVAGQAAGFATDTSGAALQPSVSTGSVTAGWILIAHALWRDTSSTPATPSGWTPLFGPANIGTTVTARHWIFGKIAVGNEGGTNISFGTAGGTIVRCARVLRYSGRVSGSITDCVPSLSFSSIAHATDPQGPTVTTTVAGSLAVAYMAQSDDNVEEAIAGATGGTWGDYLNFITALGLDAALHYCSATPTADPGTISGGAIVATNDPSGTIGFEIRPEAPAVPPEIRQGPIIAPNKAVFRAATW